MQKETIWKIYKTTCLVNGKVYIGQTMKVGKVFKCYLGGGKMLSRAIKKYGRSSFVREILITCNSQLLANEYEMLYIEMYSSRDPEIGYNITCGGSNIAGYIHSENTKVKMSQSKMGHKNHFYGKSHSSDTKFILSNLRQGKKLSNSHKSSISKGIIGGKNPLARAVESYNPTTGEALEKFDCIAEAKRQNGNCRVELCVLGLRKRANKKYWRYSK